MNCACPIGSPEPGRRTILVVEDEVLLRMRVTDELRLQGFNVAEAANADEAFSMVQSGIPIPLVLTDIKMSGALDGESLAATIRAEYPAIRILVTSGHLSESEFRLQIDGFFQKPYDVTKVVSVIKTLLEQ